MKVKERLINIYVKHNSKKKKYAEVHADMERDNFMDPKESLDYGLIDEILEKRPS